MRKFVLAAVAVLSLGVGSASAFAFTLQPKDNSVGQVFNGPGYANDSGTAGG